jgi:hypothetical protein
MFGREGLAASKHSASARACTSRLGAGGKNRAQKKTSLHLLQFRFHMSWSAQRFSKQGQHACPIARGRDGLIFYFEAARSPNGTINYVSSPAVTIRHQTAPNDTKRHQREPSTDNPGKPLWLSNASS